MALKGSEKIAVYGGIFFLIGFILIIHVPFIEVADPKQCVTEPCPQTKFISIRDMISEASDEFADSMDVIDEPVACIQIFDPVCDISGMTWSNQCLADNAGAIVLYKGECP